MVDVDLKLAEESGCCVWDSALCLGEMLLKRQLLGGGLGAVGLGRGPGCSRAQGSWSWVRARVMLDWWLLP